MQVSDAYFNGIINYCTTINIDNIRSVYIFFISPSRFKKSKVRFFTIYVKALDNLFSILSKFLKLNKLFKNKN